MQAVQAGVQNIHYLEVNASNYDDLYKWCEGHPSAVADRVIAQQLTAFIETIMLSWSNASAISTSVNQASSHFIFVMYRLQNHPGLRR